MLSKLLKATNKLTSSGTASNFRDIVSLLHGNGTNAAQNNTFVDSSSNNFTITRTGNTTQGSFSPYGNTWSNYFDGSGDYLSVSTNTAFNFGTGDFTVECYANLNSIGGLLVTAADSTGGLFFGFQSSTAFGYGRSGIGWDYTATVSVSVNQWHHFALTRSGTSIRLFIDGTQVGTTQTSSTSYDIGATNLLIGGFVSSFWVNGYISNVRIIKGTAQYTANFTPSTLPLTAVTNTSLLTCQANRFKDSSANAFSITPAGNTSVQRFSPFSISTEYVASPNASNWSNYFDGNGDYLDVGSTSYNMTGNWTIEGWFNPTSANGILFDCRPDSVNGFYALLLISTSTQLNFYYNSTDHTFTVSELLNTWNHIAVVKNSTTITVYLNGINVYSVSDSNTWTIGTSRPRIGANGGFYGSNPLAFKGYISNFRIVSNTAVYTANFTPSTTSLTAISGTSLLTCKDSTIKDSSSSNLTITAVGDVNAQQYNPFGTNTEYSITGGSAYFDGSGDYLTTPNSANLTIGTSDFTISFWVYFANLSTNMILYDQRNSIVSVYPTIYMSPSIINYYVSGASRITSSTIYAGTWTYIVVSRVSGITRLFINGTQSGSSYTDTNNYLANTVALGRDQANGGQEFKGYLSDVHTVIGTGVTSVTVPTSPVTAATNTQLLLGFKNANIYDNAAMVDYETVGSAQIDTSVKKFGTGAIKFNGTTDYLKTANNPIFDFGTGDFTIEFWLYSAIPWTSQSATAGILSNKGSDTDSAWEILRPGTAYLLARFTLQENFSTTSTPATATWEHWAVTRSGSTLRWFKNGVLDATGTNSNNIVSTNPFYIGYTNRYGSYFNGSIDDLRITKGVCLYTTNFTPPASEFLNSSSIGEASFIIPGTHSWTVPTGVTSVCVVCIGGGGAGNIDGTAGGNSSFRNTSTLYAGGGQGGGGTRAGGTGSTIDNTTIFGGNGGIGGLGNGFQGGGGGGAGGYAGNGGAGGQSGSSTGGSGSGGAGGGGGSNDPAGGGGGVGLLGQGTNGTGGSSTAGAEGGGGGSGGSNGANANSAQGAAGGTYGGGGGAHVYGGDSGGGGGGLRYSNNLSVTPGEVISIQVGAGGTNPNYPNSYGGSGAVRIIWGSGRAFPSTNTGVL